MAKKPRVNKTQAVRDYLKAHPEAMSGGIVAALTKKGIKITPAYVANIKTTISKARAAKKAAKQQAAVEAAVIVEKPAKAVDTVTLEQIRSVAQTVKAVGGFVRLNELLGLIKEVGGVKRFKDLVAAISGTETDAIPF